MLVVLLAIFASDNAADKKCCCSLQISQSLMKNSISEKSYRICHNCNEGRIRSIPINPGHKKRSRSDECGLFYVLKVVLIGLLAIPCG